MKNHTFYLIRHGERADFSENPQEIKKIKLDFDPQLTEQGKIQSKKTGKFLSNQIKNDNPIYIITSPFLRCLETSEIIYNEVQKIHGNILNEELFIHENLCEIMNKNNFQKNELSNLTFKNEENLLKCKYKFFESEKNIVFPESHENCLKRIYLAYKSLLDKFDKKSCTFIIIAHAVGVVNFLKFIEKNENSEEPFIEYCSVTKFERIDCSEKLITKAYDKHLF